MLQHAVCCACEQGFGKRKNHVGMAKPKKRKLEPVETVVPVETNAGIDQDEPISARATPPLASQPAATPSPSNGTVPHALPSSTHPIA